MIEVRAGRKGVRSAVLASGIAARTATHDRQDCSTRSVGSKKEEAQLNVRCGSSASVSLIDEGNARFYFYFYLLFVLLKLDHKVIKKSVSP